MRFQRVLLVNPSHNAEWRGVTPHIGQAYLAETLREKGIEYDVLDMNLGYGVKHLRRKIMDFQPDLVGMSLISQEYRRLYGILAEIKKCRPEAKIVVGGPHLTILKEQVLQECRPIDYGITYEGEETLVELCRDEVPETDVKGLLYRSNGDIAYTGDRGFIADRRSPYTPAGAARTTVSSAPTASSPRTSGPGAHEMWAMRSSTGTGRATGSSISMTITSI
jgi:anaerobic magnesium-protoporphyrin IX monomethyl ester cyclase